MKCSRLKCQRPAHKGHRGLCAQHHEQDQIARAARGDWIFGSVPAGEIRKHIKSLNEAGWSYRRIARASGVSLANLFLIRKRETVRADTAAKLYSVPLDGSSTLTVKTGCVPAIGSARRIRALNAIGYSLVNISREVGITAEWLSELTTGKVEWVRIDNALSLAAAFDRLQLTPAPPSRGATYARNRAARRGWPPPLAWDEDTIDNPTAEPQAPQGNRTDWHEDYLELRELGFDNDQIAERMGIQRASLLSKLQRLNAA